MSLLSPFSPFSPGKGVGSKALTHQQVPFSPFISCLSSQLPLFAFLVSASLFSSHLLFLYFICPSSFSTVCSSFHFPIWICTLCPLFPCNPQPCVSLSCPLCLSPCLLISSCHHLPTLFPLSSHTFCSYTPLFGLFLFLHCHIFFLSQPSPIHHVHLSFTLSVSLSWLLFALLVFREVHLEKWRGRRG